MLINLCPRVTVVPSLPRDKFQYGGRKCQFRLNCANLAACKCCAVPQYDRYKERFPEVVFLLSPKSQGSSV